MTFLESLKQNSISAVIFWIVFCLSILFAYIYQKKRTIYDDKGNRQISSMGKISQLIWSFLIVIGPTLIIGFRNFNVGADTTNYIIGYLQNGNKFQLTSFSVNPLFNFIRFIIYHLSNGNPTVFLTVLAFITLFILIRALEKWIDQISIPIALFVYYAFFAMKLLDQSRQMLALVIILYSIPYLLNGKKLKYYILVILATLIHFSAVIAIFYPIIKFSRTKYYSIKKVFYYLLWLIIPFLLPIMFEYAFYILPDYYKHYVQNTSLMNLGFGLVLDTVPVFIPIIFYKKYLSGEKNNFLIRLAILTFPLRLAGYYSFFLMRMQYYSAIFMVLIIPIIIENIHTKLNKKIIRALLVMLYLIYFLFSFVYINDIEVFPYKSIIELCNF